MTELSIITAQPQLFLLTSSPSHRIFPLAQAGKLLEGPQWLQALAPHTPSPSVLEAAVLNEMGSRLWVPKLRYHLEASKAYLFHLPPNA